MATAEIAHHRVGIKHMLIATDFSRRSEAVLACGQDFARMFGAQAEIVYVLPVEGFAMAGAEGLMAGLDAARRDIMELRSRLRRNAAYNDDSDFKVTLLEGPVAECLLQCATEKRDDLIVMGTHGRGGLGKAFLGSVAEKVFRHATVPVLTVGPNVHPRARMVNIPHILAPCDLSARSHEAMHFTCTLAKAHQSRLTVLHVVESKAAGTKIDPEGVKQSIRENLVEIVGRDANGLDISYRVEFGRVAASILDVATESHADLIVLGVRRSSGALDRFMWPVAYELVRDAACPVLTLRARSGPR